MIIETDEGPRYNAADVPAAIGVTYRQLDYWVRKGYLEPENVECGSGHQRLFPPDEFAVALTMAHLVRGGFTVDQAARLARIAQNSAA